MWVQSLGHEEPREEGMGTQASIRLENPMDREAWQATVLSVQS